MTFQDRIIIGLREQGYTEDKDERSRYRSFFKTGKVTKEGDLIKYFVGSHGALRVGTCASKARSIGDPGHITPRYADFLSHTNAETKYICITCNEIIWGDVMPLKCNQGHESIISEVEFDKFMKRQQKANEL